MFWRRRAPSRLLILATLSFIITGARGAAAGAPIDFNRDIRPIISKNCFACHGPDSAHRAGKLRLDRRESVTLKRKQGNAAIVPGDPERSEIYRRIIATDESLHMPPPETGNRLTSAQTATLKQWIVEGGHYAEHWAFVRPQVRAFPSVKLRGWPRNAIDTYVLARLENAGVAPTEEADRFALLRRVSLDLRGLPPTLAEAEFFARDQSPDAYEHAVDRLLADPAYGERWARMWLDLARYADSAGYGSDPLRTIWPFRDWVIDAFNRNLPFDQFTIDQIAGDLLPNATMKQRMATAFHRNTMTNTEGGTDDEEFRVAAVKDRVSTTLQVWMGLTMGCANCHSHKYDPITQREFYQFYAIFNQTADADRPDEQPVIQAPSSEQEVIQRSIDTEIARLRQLAHAGAPAIVEHITRLEKKRPAVATLPVMVELPQQKQRETRVMVKGNFQSLGDKVEPAVLSAFHPLPNSAPRDRGGVALWLVHPENPLTARVIVNRLWAQLFGIGLVESEEDFGTQGELPSHPELLDWLALEYQRRGWDTKALLRLMVTSSTYRQSARVTPDRLAKDPRNRLLSRGPRFRLEAEMVRDQALALGGLLSRKIYGPSVYPPQPAGLWQAAFNGQRTWATSQGDDRYRRGLYTFWRRTVPYPSMATFDAPSRETCAVRRIRTNTPLQAFVTLNDPVYVEAAQALARRIVREGGATVEDRARFGLQLCLARPPHPEQVRQIVELYRSEREHYRSNTAAATALATEPLRAAPTALDTADLAAWTVVANVLLNLDAVLSKG